MELKKQIVRSRAISRAIIDDIYPRIPSREAFYRDIDIMSRYFNSGCPSPPSRFQSEVEVLGELLMYHTRTRWTRNVFSLADRAVSLQGLYRQSGKVMRCVSRTLPHCGVRDCVVFQFARTLHWTAAHKLQELIPMRMSAACSGDQGLLDTKLERSPSPEIGAILMNRCLMSEHGHLTDNSRADDSIPRGNILYLTDSEAAHHRILIRDGKLHFAATGLLLDTSGQEYTNPQHVAGPRFEPFREPDLGSAGYVLSLKGELYAGVHAPFDTPEECMGKHPYFHSSYLGGGDVLCAGRIFVRNGKLVGIDNGSGHYKPTADQLRRGVRDLERQGVPIDGLYCEDISRTNRLRANPGRGQTPYEMLWPQACDFLSGIEGGPLPREKIRHMVGPLKKAVSDYRHSRGLFSNTSVETKAALEVLTAVESDDDTFCTSCVWYAFSPGTSNDDRRWLGNAEDYVHSKAFVRMTPLEVGAQTSRFSRQRFKSGLRTALRANLPERLTEIVGVYDS